MILGRAGRLVCASAVALSSLGLEGGQAQAAPLTVSLTYTAGAGCPGAADFKAVVVARLGYDPFLEDAADRVLVEIEPRANGLGGRIEWRDSSGKWSGDQTFPSVSADCQRLVRVMGFALAVQIQLLAKGAPAAAPNDAATAETRSAPEASGLQTPEKAQAAPASPPAPTVPGGPDLAPSPAGRARPVFALGAGPSVGLGMSSVPVLLGRLFGVLAWQHLSVELGAAASLPTTTRRPDGAGFSQQHLLGSVAGCAVVTRWTACLLVNAGEVRMAGENIDRPTSASVFIAEAGVRAGINQPLGHRTRLGAHADGLVNLTRWTGSLDQVPVWTAPRFGASIALDASVLFP